MGRVSSISSHVPSYLTETSRIVFRTFCHQQITFQIFSLRITFGQVFYVSFQTGLQISRVTTAWISFILVPCFSYYYDYLHIILSKASWSFAACSLQTIISRSWFPSQNNLSNTNLCEMLQLAENTSPLLSLLQKCTTLKWFCRDKGDLLHSPYYILLHRLILLSVIKCIEGPIDFSLCAAEVPCNIWIFLLLLPLQTFALWIHFNRKRIFDHEQQRLISSTRDTLGWSFPKLFWL